MIIVDWSRCCYCGGCVSLCPVDAIVLQETRLLIGENCTQCGLCLPACPVGALSIGEEPATAEPLRRSYDVVIVGAGPAGSTAARTAAQRGLSVLLLEKRQEIGSPVRCAEGIAHDALAAFIEPDPRWIAAMVTRERIITVQGGQEREALFADGDVGYVLERRLFDRALAEKAVEAGAQILVKTAAVGLIREDGVVRGVVAEHGGERLHIEARVVIGADGVESRVARWAGLPLLLRGRETLVCAQYTLTGIKVEPDCCTYTLGDEVAPGGYAWVFPKGAGKANVGLGVRGDLAQRPALEYLTRFVEARPFLAQGSPVTLIAGNVPLGMPPQRFVTGGCMIVGDAAHQAEPITGGGIANAMLATRYAAEVAAQAIESGDVSAEALEAYPRRWGATRGRQMARNLRLRERFPGPARVSEAFVRVFAIAASGR